MSFFVKAILGQNVVHPITVSSSSQSSTQRSLAGNTPLTEQGNADKRSKSAEETKRQGRQTSTSTEACPTLTADSTRGTTTTTTTPTPLRTLILRLHTCTLVQDVRDTLRELEVAVALPYAMTPNELAPLLSLLHRYADDEAMMRSMLHILINVTDPMRYPETSLDSDFAARFAGGYGKESNAVEVPLRERRRLSESFLQVLLPDAVPLLLSQLATTLKSSPIRATQQEHDNTLDQAGMSSSIASPSSSYWIPYYATQLLRRLEEFSPSTVHKLLIDGHGAETMVSLLQDSRQERALQKECLLFLQSLTATDTELQTILAFHGVFDTLFGLVREVDATVATEGDIALDALATVHNIVRGNTATQKLFREMNTAAELVPILRSVQLALQPPEQTQETNTHKQQQAGKQPRLPLTESSAPNEPLMLPVPPPYTHVITHNNKENGGGGSSSSIYSNHHSAPHTHVPIVHGTRATEVLLAIGLLACLLRDAEFDRAGNDLPALQANLVHNNVLRVLVGVALSGHDSIDDGTRIEALRCTAALLRGSRVAVESFLQPRSALRSVAAVQSGMTHSPRAAILWQPCRALLEELFTSEDATMLEACVQTVQALFSVPACQPHVLDVLLRRLGPLDSTAAIKATVPSAASPSNALASFATWIECGEALVGALFGRWCGVVSSESKLRSSASPPPYAMYYATHVMNSILLMPYIATSLLEMSWASTSSSAATPSAGADGPSVSLSDATATSAPVSTRHATFFVVYVTFLMEQFGIGSEAASGGNSHAMHDAHGGTASVQQGRPASVVLSGRCRMGSSVLTAHVRVLLTWLRHARGAAVVMGEDGLWFDGLLRCARTEGPVQVRLMSAILAAAVAVGVAASVSTSPSSVSVPGAVAAEGEAVGVVAAAESILERVSGEGAANKRHLLDDLVTRFVAQLGGPSFFDGMLFDLEATTPQWLHPAACAFAAPPLVTFDVALVNTMRAVMEEFRALVMVRQGAADSLPAAVVVPEASNLNDTIGNVEKNNAGVNTSDTKRNEDDDDHMDADNMVASVEPHSSDRVSGVNLHSSHPPTCSFGSAHGEMRDGAYDVGSAAGTAQPTCLVSADATTRYEEKHEGALESCQEANVRLRAELAECQTRLTQQETLLRERHAADCRHLQVQHENALAELRENVQLLEEALAAKDEEQIALTQSLDAMERELRALTKQKEQQQQKLMSQMHTSEEMTSATAATDAKTPSPPPHLHTTAEEAVHTFFSEQRQDNAVTGGKSDEVNEAAEAERLEQLQADHDALLLLVAELTEECERLRRLNNSTPGVSVEVCPVSVCLTEPKHEESISARDVRASQEQPDTHHAMGEPHTATESNANTNCLPTHSSPINCYNSHNTDTTNHHNGTYTAHGTYRNAFATNRDHYANGDVPHMRPTYSSRAPLEYTNSSDASRHHPLNVVMHDTYLSDHLMRHDDSRSDPYRLPPRSGSENRGAGALLDTETFSPSPTPPLGARVLSSRPHLQQLPAHDGAAAAAAPSSLNSSTGANNRDNNISSNTSTSNYNTYADRPAEHHAADNPFVHDIETVSEAPDHVPAMRQSAGHCIERQERRLTDQEEEAAIQLSSNPRIGSPLRDPFDTAWVSWTERTGTMDTSGQDVRSAKAEARADTTAAMAMECGDNPFANDNDGGDEDASEGDFLL